MVGPVLRPPDGLRSAAAHLGRRILAARRGHIAHSREQALFTVTKMDTVDDQRPRRTRSSRLAPIYRLEEEPERNVDDDVATPFQTRPPGLVPRSPVLPADIVRPALR